MKTISKQLFIFLENHIQNKYVNLEKRNHSALSKSFLINIFKTIIQAENNYKEITPNYKKVNRETLPKGYDFDYCHPLIQTEIYKMSKTACLFSFSVKNHFFQIVIVSPETQNHCEKKMKTYMKNIYIWLNLAIVYAHSSCSQNLNIYLYLTDLKKELPSNKENFSQIHANTAFTTSCKKNTEIHIYREEEWFKVLIHESFHCFGLDFSSLNQSNINKEILSIFPIRSKVNLFEVYCETFAEIINVMFISLRLTKKKENLDKYLKNLVEKTEQLLQNERVFSLFQCGKVLDFYGITYTDLYEKKESAIINRKKYRENNTNIFSYYILKAVFLFYYDDFLEWCFLYNNQSLLFQEKHIVEFIGFIKNHYKAPEFSREIENIETFYRNSSHEKKIDIVIRNTMRMSLYEL